MGRWSIGDISLVIAICLIVLCMTLDVAMSGGYVTHDTRLPYVRKISGTWPSRMPDSTEMVMASVSRSNLMFWHSWHSYTMTRICLHLFQSAWRLGRSDTAFGSSQQIRFRRLCAQCKLHQHGMDHPPAAGTVGTCPGPAAA